MTMDELRTWNESGCVWRCLKKLANETGNTITKEEFLAQFNNLPGEFDAASLGPILRQLGLPERSGERLARSIVGLRHLNTVLCQADFDYGLLVHAFIRCDSDEF
jgi:hypothetical protein